MAQPYRTLIVPKRKHPASVLSSIILPNKHKSCTKIAIYLRIRNVTAKATEHYIPMLQAVVGLTAYSREATTTRSGLTEH